ncbi:hypothetical protein EI77_02341 [Prosthecobacter fusiformis]|uniref:Uncharacterized protein n=1 Tax=Prosthecobacter fusiformis TaxID=48464 RepID=A0A4R7S0N5_9BACT|nr:hypothetical protein [Prosthecobacter fusiformis]TDU71219.1 hypothetical protein EI77_02341 [Prosthecobacter fusiformis]
MKTPMRPLMFLLMLCSLMLCQCTTISPEAKANIKKVVVATNVGHKVTRQKVGFTAFGNSAISSIETPELRSEVQKMLKAEISSRFPTTVFASEQPPPNPKSMFGKYPDYKTWAKNLAAKYQADAVLLITGIYGYPYAAPSYMTAEGMGIWHIGDNAVVENYTYISLMDAVTGNRLAFSTRMYGGQTIKVPALDNFNDYTSAEKTRLIQACVEEFRLDLKAYLDGSGL